MKDRKNVSLHPEIRRAIERSAYGISGEHINRVREWIVADGETGARDAISKKLESMNEHYVKLDQVHERLIPDGNRATLNSKHKIDFPLWELASVEAALVAGLAQVVIPLARAGKLESSGDDAKYLGKYISDLARVIRKIHVHTSQNLYLPPELSRVEELCNAGDEISHLLGGTLIGALDKSEQDRIRAITDECGLKVFGVHRKQNGEDNGDGDEPDRSGDTERG